MTTNTAPAGPLTARATPIDIEAAAFRRIGHQLVDAVAERLAGIAGGPVTRNDTPAAIRRALDAEASLPETGMDAEQLLLETTALLFDRSIFNGHPRFFGYITGSPSPIGMFGDFLAAAVNQNVGAWSLAPVATEIERQTVRWLGELIGFPAGGGLLVSGGNMANFVGFLAARAATADWPVRSEGLAGRSLVVYVSSEAHTWIQKAADLFGLGTTAIRWIPSDATQRMDVAGLRRQIDADREAGHRPFLVVGTAGSVSTGAVDPLADLAAVCREHGLWFHVDGAYGAVAALADGAPPDLRALGHADSVAVDPHKWLYAPLEAGCVLVRDAQALAKAFSYHPAYYGFDEHVLNYFELGPQNSRGFRALKVWLALKQVGRTGHLSMVADDMRLARYLYDRSGAHDELQPITQALSITTFRYVPADLRSRLGTPDVERYLDALNRALLVAIEQSGDAFLSSAVVGTTFVLRACIVNFHTTARDIDALVALASRLGRATDAELRRTAAAHLQRSTS